MKTLRSLYHLVRADLLERIRRYSFLVSVGVTLYIGYISVPAAIFVIKRNPPKTFEWGGIAWTYEIIAGRLLWVGVALGIVLVAALLFHRFDPAREKGKPTREEADPRPVAEEVPAASTRPDLDLSHLTPASIDYRFGRTVRSEVVLMLKGLRWWWYAVALGVLVVQASVSVKTGREVWLPIAWIWPLAIWSSMGTREGHHFTDQLVFSSAHSLRHQFLALWLAGVLVTALTGSGVGGRLLLAGDWGGIWGWVVATLFVPTLALTLGVWGRTGRLFEGVYMVLWYAGPIQKFPALDFMATLPRSIEHGLPLIYLVSTLVLLGFAIWGRQRQLRT